MIYKKNPNKQTKFKPKNKWCPTNSIQFELFLTKPISTSEFNLAHECFICFLRIYRTGIRITKIIIKRNYDKSCCIKDNLTVHQNRKKRKCHKFITV